MLDTPVTVLILQGPLSSSHTVCCDAESWFAEATGQRYKEFGAAAALEYAAKLVPDFSGTLWMVVLRILAMENHGEFGI